MTPEKTPEKTPAEIVPRPDSDIQQPRQEAMRLPALLEMAAHLSPEHQRRLVDLEISRGEFELRQRFAIACAKSGEFAHCRGKSQEQMIATCVAVIEIGVQLGLTPAASMQAVYFVNGRPAVMTEVRAEAMIRLGYSWDVAWTRDDTGRKTAIKLYLKHSGQPVMDADGNRVWESFSLDDAVAAGYLAKSKGGPWDNPVHRESMLYWACLRQIQKVYVPGVLTTAADYRESSVTQPPDLPTGSRAAQIEVAERRIAELSAPVADPALTPPAEDPAPAGRPKGLFR